MGKPGPPSDPTHTAGCRSQNGGGEALGSSPGRPAAGGGRGAVNRGSGRGGQRAGGGEAGSRGRGRRRVPRRRAHLVLLVVADAAHQVLQVLVEHAVDAALDHL